MKRARAQGAPPPPRRRPLLPAPPPPADDDSSEDEGPEEAPLAAAPASKRARKVAQHHSSSEGSKGDSGSSESDSEDEGGSSGDEGDDGEEGLPMGQLAALRQDGSTSAAAMRSRARLAEKRAGGKRTFKREGKHRPVEASSKRPVPVLRDTLGGGKRVGRDPRFESLSAGQYDEARFKRQYAFLYTEKLPAERAELRAALARTKGGPARERLAAQLAAVEQQLRSEEARRKRDGFKEAVKAKERASAREGKGPFYLKKSERRRQELLAQYEELQASGKLDKFLEKRRRKNAAKTHRLLPSGRRGGGGDE